MVTIYALINPIDKKPFYIGSTRHELKKRLSSHLCDSGINVMRGQSEACVLKRHLLFIHLKAAGLRPTIVPLFITSEQLACKFEKSCYEYFTQLGYELHQSKERFIRNKVS